MDPERPSDEMLDGGWLDVPDPVGQVAPQKRAPSAPVGPSPTRAKVRTRRIGALVGALAWAAMVLSFFGPRDDMAEEAAIVATGAGVASAMLVVLLRVSLGGGTRGLGPKRSWARALAVGGPAAFVAWALLFVRGEGFAALGPTSAVLACAGVALLIIAPAMALGMVAVRRSFVTGAGWRGALLGAACGAVGAIVLTFHCTSP